MAAWVSCMHHLVEEQKPWAQDSDAYLPVEHRLEESEREPEQELPKGFPLAEGKNRHSVEERRKVVDCRSVGQRQVEADNQMAWEDKDCSSRRRRPSGV
jgi:hypothetical protein